MKSHFEQISGYRTNNTWRQAVIVFAISVYGAGMSSPAFAGHDNPPEYVMDNTQITSCSGLFFDSGGDIFPYDHDEDLVKTFFPNDTSREKLRFDFSMFNIESTPALQTLPFDYLTVYDGNSTSAPVIGQYFPRIGGGGLIPDIITSTAADGSLTFQFHSDGGTHDAGWMASFHCVPSFKAVFAMNQRQSLWGPGTTATPPNSGRFEYLTVPRYQFGTPQSDIVTIAGQDFGARFDAGISGELGFQIEALDIRPGDLFISYPADVVLGIPPADSFRAGEWITIDSFYNVKPEDNPTMNTSSPGMKLDLEGRATLSAAVGTRLCFFDCWGFNLFPPLNFTVNQTILKLNPAGQSVSIINEELVAANTPFTIPAIPAALSGISGTVDTPDLGVSGDPGSFQIVGNDFVVTRADQFMDLDFDVDTWITRFPGLPSGVGTVLESPIDLPLSPPAPPGTTVGWTLADLDVQVDMIQEFTYRFSPKVLVTMNLSHPVRHRLRRGAQVFPERVASTISFEAGDTVELLVPDEILDIATNCTLLNPKFTNDNTTRIRRDYHLRGLELHMDIPGVHIGCWPEICFGFGCTPGYCLGYDGLDFNVGPIMDIDVPLDSSTDPRLFGTAHREFNLQGFSPVQGENVSVDPEFPPVAHLVGPTEVLLEGDTANFSAAASFDRDNDPLTYHWNFGDGSAQTFGGPEASHAYGDNGTYTVTVTVDDGHGFPSVATFDVTFLNVAPELPTPPNPIIEVDEGSIAVVPTAATDPGFHDLFSNLTDFGDGTGIDGRHTSYLLPSVDHVYADNGDYAVGYCVIDDDGGSDCENVTVRVHNVAPTVSAVASIDTQFQSGGGSVEVSVRVVANFNDSGTLDTHTATLDWGDGTSDALVVTEAPFGPPGLTRGADGRANGELTHIYTTAGTFPLRACVMDDDGAESCAFVEDLEIPEADLQVVRVVDPPAATPVELDSNITYTFTVTNDGPDDVEDVRIVDVLPPGTELVSAVRGVDDRIEFKLTAEMATDEAFFGNSVSLLGNRLVVGSPNQAGSGAAYVFIPNGADWIQDTKLTLGEGPEFLSSEFGSDIAQDGDVIVVGSPAARDVDSDSTGAVYIYRLDDDIWTLKQVLFASDGAASDRFGDSVAISGDMLIVGAPRHDSNAGAVYTFHFDGTNWTEQQKFSHLPGSEFGKKVSISGDTFAATAPGSVFSSGRPGMVRVFRRTGDTWNVEASIEESDVPDLSNPNTFAGSVDLDADTLLIGTQKFSSNVEPSSVHVFTRTGAVWSPQAKIVAADATVGDSFGKSVHIDGDKALIGAPDADDNNGAEYVFTRSGSTWEQVAKLTVSDAPSFRLFGTSVAGDGDTIVGGAVFGEDFDESGLTIFPGAAYVFTLCPEDPAGTVTCGLGTIPSGGFAMVEITAKVGCSLGSQPFISTDLTNNASVLGRALESVPADNVDIVTSTTAPPPQGVCGADFTPPNVSPVVLGTLGANGWYTSDVEISWIVDDADSPITSQSGCDPTSIVSDTSGSTVTCTVTSAGGTTTESITIKRDATPPEISSVVVGTLGSNDWHTTDVEITFDCTDAVSGIGECSGATTLTDEGMNPCVIGTAIDEAGNSASVAVDGIKIDKTPPSITASRTPANSSGWNNIDVSVAFDCVDSVSGVVDCTPPTLFDTEGAGQSVTGTATDAAGHQATILVNNINIDKTPPIIVADATPDANAAGWRNTIVNVEFVCADTVSGVSSCTPTVVIESEGVDQSATGTVVDLAGNTAMATVGDIDIDWTPPTIVATADPAPDTNGLNDAPVMISYHCEDILSGVANCSPTESLTDIGYGQSAIGTATDIAGNTADANVEGINIGRPAIIPSADLFIIEGDLVGSDIAMITEFAVTNAAATINWGDGASVDAATLIPVANDAGVNGSHVFADDGDYLVEVCTADLFERLICETLTASVANAPPTISAIDVLSPIIDFGAVAQVSMTFNDLGTSDTHTATIDWGDGSAIEIVDAIEGPFGPPGDVAGMTGTIFGTHVYAAAGDYTGQICVEDDDGEAECGSFSLTVRPDLPPACSISVASVACSGSSAVVTLGVDTQNFGTSPVAFNWNLIHGAVTFDDKTIASPTITVDLSQDPTLPPMTCTVTPSLESGLATAECASPLVIPQMDDGGNACAVAGQTSCVRDCDCILDAVDDVAGTNAHASDVIDVCDLTYCDNGQCVSCTRRFGKTCGPYNEVVDTGDILCAVSAFGDYCSCPNADVWDANAPGCSSETPELCKGPSGVPVTTADILAAANAFGGINPFGCAVPGDPTCNSLMPSAADGCMAASTSLTLANEGNGDSFGIANSLLSEAVFSIVPRRSSARPGGLLEVDVFVSNVSTLIGYEFGLTADSDVIGESKLVAVDIDTSRRDYVFSNLSSFPAIDKELGRIGGVAIDGSANVPESERRYLGTFTFEIASNVRSLISLRALPEFTTLYGINGHQGIKAIANADVLVTERESRK